MAAHQKSETLNREAKLQALRERPEVPVLIIGGGINGIGVLRDLALQGLDALLVERGDFGSGASAASSHMLHGGLRYLENGEFRLVNEALHERDRMLLNAPHYAQPLRTTIPIFRWFSGLFNAPLKFLGALDSPGERGALVIKIGLTLYDFLARHGRTLPRHEFRLRAAALREYPRLNPTLVCAASYYDAWMPSPERICLELALDAEASGSGARALNYMRALDAEADAVLLRDELSGETCRVTPQVVVNAAGPWIDQVQAHLGRAGQRFIGGTKGSHLMLDNPELLAALGDSEIFFENEDGRIVLLLPFSQRVMIGTTDIRLDEPDEAVITDAEIDYLIEMVGRVFPDIAVERSQIVFSFSGVRPLPYSAAGADGKPGQISRDHSIRSLPATAERRYPVHALIGGKWTTFRAFAEEATDLVLRDLGRQRRVDTKNCAIGGGRGYPTGAQERAQWLRDRQSETALPAERLTALFERYGTRAADFARFIAAGQDCPLAHAPSYSQREIECMLRYEMVARLDDLLLRRSLIAMLGGAKRALLTEMAALCAQTLGWTAARQTEEIERAASILRDKHRVKL